MNENKCDRGQGLVEFALILPILLLTVLLFMYFAQLFNTWSGLQAGAVAGAALGGWLRRPTRPSAHPPTL